MEELQKTQEYPIEREQERRVSQQSFTGEDRRKRATWTSTVLGPDSPEPPVSTEDGTKRG